MNRRSFLRALGLAPIGVPVALAAAKAASAEQGLAYTQGIAGEFVSGLTARVDGRAVGSMVFDARNLQISGGIEIDHRCFEHPVTISRSDLAVEPPAGTSDQG